MKGFPLPSFKQLIVFAALFAAGAYGFHLYYKAQQDAQLGGVAARVVKEYYSLEKSPNPSFISPYMIVQSTDKVRGRPHPGHRIRRLPLPRLPVHVRAAQPAEAEFAGKINIAFQFSPWTGMQRRSSPRSDLHAGACDLAYIAAKDPASFAEIYNEIFTHFQEAKDPQWRAELAKKYGVEAALDRSGDQGPRRSDHDTGAEYRRTSSQFAHGIRSTPTLVVNNRMIIGTLPYPQIKAIFESLAAEGAKTGDRRFFENWVEFQPKKK